MAEYKDIYYADSSEQISAGAISYAEAVSVGNKVEEIYYDSAINVYMSGKTRSQLYPNPVQGDAVYIVGWGEQRYYEAYSAKINPGGKATAGWYTTTSKIRPVIPSSVTGSGTGSSHSINSLGEISFSKSLGIYVNNCFVGFNSYKVIIDVTSTSGTFSFPVWGFLKNGVTISSSGYTATYQGVSAGANAGGTWSHPNVVPATIPNVGVYTTSFELNIDAPMDLNGSTYFIGYNSQSWSYTSASNNSLQMLSGGVQTTMTPDGIVFYPANGLMPMTGTMKVYGIA